MRRAFGGCITPGRSWPLCGPKSVFSGRQKQPCPPLLRLLGAPREVMLGNQFISHCFGLRLGWGWPPGEAPGNPSAPPQRPPGTTFLFLLPPPTCPSFLSSFRCCWPNPGPALAGLLGWASCPPPLLEAACPACRSRPPWPARLELQHVSRRQKCCCCLQHPPPGCSTHPRPLERPSEAHCRRPGRGGGYSGPAAHAKVLKSLGSLLVCRFKSQLRLSLVTWLWPMCAFDSSVNSG